VKYTVAYALKKWRLKSNAGSNSCNRDDRRLSMHVDGQR
jgi:hypothetical protein